MMRLARVFSLLPGSCNPSGRRLFGLLAALACMFVLAGNVSAQTAVSGAIVGDTRWTAADGPYLLSGNVLIQGGATLTIDAGVRIYMGADAGVTVQAGSVRANGVASNPIQVLSDRSRTAQGTPGDWGQWVFSAGTVNTRLEHVLFEHGRGLVVNGASPIFNFVTIRGHQGVAMAIDLSASPSGVGNVASGNSLNGIAVPAGDVVGNVRWGLRGIPYVVSAGVVSVGASPSIQSVSPATVEQGQTVTLTVNGSRLTGLTRAELDRAGLTLTPFSGGNSSQLFLQLRADASATPGPATLRLQVDAGELVLPNAVLVTAPLPAVTAISPTTVMAQSGNTVITVTGRNFTSASEVTFNAAAAATQYISATELRATLLSQPASGSLQLQVRSPIAGLPGQYLLSNTTPLTVTPPVPPTVAIEPAPIALPPDGRGRDITIRLSRADYRDNTLNFSVSDLSKATVSPASVLIPAGQTTATVTITPVSAGTASLIVESINLARITAPLYITTDFRGVNTSYARPVGVVVQAAPGTQTRDLTVADATVGVTVGAFMTSVAPAAWVAGETTTLVVRGVGIPSNAQVSMVPADGLTLGTASVNAEGTELRVDVSSASNVSVGMRRVVVRDASGNSLTFARADRSLVRLVTGLPSIQSISPVVVLRGGVLNLVIRGQHLQQAAVRIHPADGLQVDTEPTVSDDGSSLTVRVEVAANATLGARAIQVVTPAGASSTVLSAANTLTLVSELRGALTPVSALVGLVVGQSASVPDPVVVQSGSGAVGLLVGAGVTGVTPKVGVIGEDVLVTVTGVGLQSVSTVAFQPSAGVTLQGAHTVNAEGSSLSFTVRIAADAATGARRLVLRSADGLPLTMVRFTDMSFLVSAPIPELIAVAPQVLLMGQAPVRVTLRGRNFTNVTGVRLEPNTGVTVTGPFATNTEGTELSFDASVATGSGSGARAVVVSTAAGESTLVQHAGNLVRVAATLGPTYASVPSAPVGVLVGSATGPAETIDNPVLSVAVGVMVGGVPAQEPTQSLAVSPKVSVVVGSSAQTMTPRGWLQGSSGAITVTGQGLDAVTAVAVVPATGVLLNAPVLTGGGTVLTVPISVAPDAPRVLRELRLTTASGNVVFINPELARFGIGSLPTLGSVSPIVLEQGRGAVLTIRGSNLQGVTGVAFAPDAGLRLASDITWGTDGLGEFLTLTIQVDSVAPLGSRVLRLEVPGGVTSATPTPANSLNVVLPQ